MSDVDDTVIPPNLSCLKNMDALLRCPICFEYLNISMMTQCSHNFCSLCIRKFLSYKLQCPVCNTPMTELDLRNNRILDDLVQSFQATRQQWSQSNFDLAPIPPRTPSSVCKSKPARKRAPRGEGTILSHFFQKPPAVSPVAEATEQRARREARAGGPAGPRLSVKDEPMEICAQGPGAIKSEAEETAVHASSRVKKERKMDPRTSPTTSQDAKPLVKVECPVCGVGVSQQYVNKHLDSCLTRDEKKEGLRSSDKRRPMPKIVYTLLSMQELKRRMRVCQLSTQGSRDQLVKRHQDFVHIFNAQCDSLNPMSAEDIAKEVENNERTRNHLEAKSKRAIVITKKHTAEDIEELHSNYRKQHSSEFSRLIAQVKGRLETSRKVPLKQDSDGEAATSTTSPAEGHRLHGNILPNMSQAIKTEQTSDTELRSRSPSPCLSEVSISSSISDVFS